MKVQALILSAAMALSVIVSGIVSVTVSGIVSGTAARASTAPKSNPCAPLVHACTQAGYKMASERGRHRLAFSCLENLISGETVHARDGSVVPEPDEQVRAACKAKHDALKSGH